MTAIAREMVAWGKRLFERRLVSGWGGNISCRLSDGDILITGQHAPLGFLTASDIVRLTSDGKARGKNRRASSETPMHLAIYQGTDARAVIHAHPPMTLAYSFDHDRFDPLSFEEKFTVGTVAVITQETPTVTRPEALVESLLYQPIVIVKGHGTVAVGGDLKEAFLLTDLLEEAVRCHAFRAQAGSPRPQTGVSANAARPQPSANHAYPLFSREHMHALVKSVKEDQQFRADGSATGLTTSLTLHLRDSDAFWTVKFTAGEIAGIEQSADGEFLISAEKRWWEAVFNNRMDPFFATLRGKLTLERGDLAKLAQWYKPFQRAFTLWQTIPVR